MYNVITERLKLVDAYPEKVADIASRFKLEDPEFIRKGLTVDDLKLEEGERAVISHITTGAKDRDDEIVDPKGAMLADFKKNPVVLWGHDHRSLPIGRAVWVKADEKGLVAKVAYASAEVNPFAEQVFKAHQEKIPIAKSIGFIPIVVEEPKEGSPEFKQGVRRIFRKWIMLEFSDVPVPSNPEAINIAVSKGLISEDEKEGYGITIVDDEPEEKEIKTVPVMANLKVQYDKSMKEILKLDDEQVDKVNELIRSFGNETKEQIENANFLQVGEIKFELTQEQSKTLTDMNDKDVHDVIELVEYYLSEKAGRVLSSKNRTLISNAVRAMSAAITPMNQLLSDTEKPPKPDDDDTETSDSDNDDDKKDFITLADEPEPDYQKEIDAQVNKLLKQKITESITDVLKRQRGKV
ncbi:hypothetical protein LCGC14_0758220 [marine sediment metagenome]|uniref:Prohead protease n=1 Tax=marine sediment metagenome TaxID=412755 RepID=A0A0F9Q230_9ZZZZ